MRLVVAAVLLLLASSRAAAQQVRDTASAARPAASDTLSNRPVLGTQHLENAFPIRFPRSKWQPPFFLRHTLRDWVGEWDASTRERLRAVSDSLLLASRFGTRLMSADAVATPRPRLADDAVVAAKAAEGDTAAARTGILSGALSRYADIGMRVGGRGEMGGAWTKYAPCDPALHLTCSPSLFPQLKPDMQFNIQVAGTISDRIHVDVDYDQAREFDAANNINVYYQGREDEILQRVELGDVSIQLPSSRYLTQGIPAGNFGLKAVGQLGPLDFQTVFAQQRGDVATREFRLGGTGGSQDLVQDAELVADDADYVQGQFFFIVPPDSLPGAPHIDVLSLLATDAPASLRPESNVRIQVYRDEKVSATNPQQQAQLGYFLAEAVNGYSHRGLFRRLVPDEHYIVHPSGLWLMLKSPLRPDEALAISYITASGDTIGTFNAEAAPPEPVPTLKLLRGTAAYHQPNTGTWSYEMHQVYRLVSSGSVDPNTIDLRISLGDVSGGRTFRDVNGRQVPLIRFFGLDEDSPADVVDAAQIWQPGQIPGGGTIGTSPIGGTYVIFPSLQPFKDPGAVPSEQLSAGDVLAALGTDANAAIYDNEDPVVRENSGRFRLNFKYRLKVEGMVSTFSLGALGIREGSERLTLGSRTLQRGTDYTIDYEIGMVTLNNAQALFAANPGSELRATWEQKSMFEVGATSVLGMNARYRLGRAGELNFVGLYQSEKSQFARPQLGVEPGSIFMGGVSGRLELGGAFIDRTLALIPGLRLGGTSSVSLNGELAFSSPNPNRKNEAFLDDFESTDERYIPMSRKGWWLGSRPQSLEHAGTVFPAALDVSTATNLVWQHDVYTNGQVGGGIYPRDIDRQIVVAGNQRPESVLWLTFGDTIGNDGTKRWRSITTVLSTSGIDMSRSEYLEFYLWNAGRPGQALVFDIGVVSEDAYYYDENGLTNGTYPADSGAPGREWGLGEADMEAELGIDIWGPDKDALGLWNQQCSGNALEQYVLGDPNANCTRRNNRPDTEDLDGDGVVRLNDEPYFRFVVPIDDTSPYLVRDRMETGTEFRLFRIPLRTDGRPVGGANDATWRFVRNMRMTVVSAPESRENFVFARMRIVGARWTKRDAHGVSRGLIGDEPGFSAGTAQVQVSPVSRLTDGIVYSPPTGVNEEIQDPSTQFGGAVEYNEKAMRIVYEGVDPGDRVETYYRFAQQARSFLTYRQLRLWALARSGNFGPTGDQRFVVKIGNDARNYYIYQTKLQPPVTDRVLPGDWLPEIVIDFEPWFQLREQAEQQLATMTPAPGEPLVYWSADSTYGIVLEDRARAPNLGAVRELAFGIYNGGGGPADGEVWVNDMRLSGAMRDPGMAGNIALDIRGGDFLSANLTYANRGANFRQLNQDATYQQQDEFSFASTAQLGNMLPGGWGIDMPLTVGYSRASNDPVFLQSTDVRAQNLTGLRETGATAKRVSMMMRKRTPSTNPFVSVLVDGLTLRASYASADNSSMTLRSETEGFDGGLSYTRNIKPLTFGFLPGFVESALRLLTPGFIENSDAFQRFSDARFRFTPERISFGSTYYAQERRAYQFTNALAGPADSAVRPVESPRRGLDSDAQLAFRPFQPLTAVFSLRTSRDLLPTERASNRRAEQSAIGEARDHFAGIDMGWETSRSLNTDIAFRPQVTSWLRPGYTYTARFGTSRNPSYLQLVGGDSTKAYMQRRFQADRQTQKSLQVEPGGLINALLGTATKAAGDTTSATEVSGWKSFVSRLGDSWRSVDVAWTSTLGSQFERELVKPGLGYQFGLGNLDGFRLIGGDTAIVVNSRDQFTARSAFQLPAASSVALGYERTLIDAFDQRGGHRTQLDRKWPSIQATVNNVPVPGFLNGVIRRMMLTAGYEHTRQSSVLDEVAGNEKAGVETRVSPGFTLLLPGNLSLSYRGTLSNGESSDPTGSTEQTGADHAVTLTGMFHPPQSMQDRLRAPFTVNFTFRDQSQHQCRERLGSTLPGLATGCVPYIDFGNRSINIDVSTIFTDVTVGLNIGYNSRQNYIGTKNGTSQFQLGLWGEFNFCAGTIGDCRNTIR